jgi:hypothetical protein
LSYIETINAVTQTHKFVVIHSHKFIVYHILDKNEVIQTQKFTFIHSHKFVFYHILDKNIVIHNNNYNVVIHILQCCHSHITMLSFTYKNVVYHIHCQQSMSLSINKSIDKNIDEYIHKSVDIVG